MKRQKKIRNIKYKDIYNLDSTIARFILPRLKFFRKKICSCPYGFTLEEWEDILALRLYDKTGPAHPDCHIVMAMVRDQINEFAKAHNIDYQV